MPLYTYHCEACGDFILSRVIAQRDEPSPCPDCGQGARRELAMPNLRAISPARLKAHAINERSQHEPKFSGHRCSSGCGCGPSRPKSSKPAPRFLTGRGNSRPWMLGH